jgi:hypothetical protein
MTTSRKRLENLVRAARATPDVREAAPMFLFTTESELRLDAPETIFSKIWTSVAGGEPCSILERSPKIQTKEGSMGAGNTIQDEVRDGP